jgi:hypothetical protein
VKKCNPTLWPQPATFYLTTWINGQKINLSGCTKTPAGYHHPEHGKLDPIYIKNVREK